MGSGSEVIHDNPLRVSGWGSHGEHLLRPDPTPTHKVSAYVISLGCIPYLLTSQVPCTGQGSTGRASSNAWWAKGLVCEIAAPLGGSAQHEDLETHGKQAMGWLRRGVMAWKIMIRWTLNRGYWGDRLRTP